MVETPAQSAPPERRGEAAGLAPMTLRLDPYVLPLFLLAASAGLVLCYVFTQKVMPLVLHGHGATDRVVRFFDLDAEGNLPSWFSATLWTFASLLAFGAAAQRHKTQRDRSRWTALGVLYLFLSMDEMAAWHEMLGIALRRVPGLVGAVHYAWIGYGVVFTLLVGAYFAPFVLRLPRYVTGCIALAASVYLTCAVGLEFVAGKVKDGVFQYPFGLTDFHEIMVEEFGEMLGVVILIHGLLVFLRINDPSRAFTVEVRGPADGRAA